MLRLVWEVEDQPEGGKPGEYGDNSFENEDPGPPTQPADTFHEGDRAGEKTAKGAGGGSRGEEDSL